MGTVVSKEEVRPQWRVRPYDGKTQSVLFIFRGIAAAAVWRMNHRQAGLEADCSVVHA